MNPRGERIHPTSVVVAGSIAIAAIGLIVALHLTAVGLNQSSWGGGSLGRRVALATRAARLEPWNRAFRVRVLWLAGELQLQRGDYNASVETLAQAYRSDVGNQELLALFKRAQAVQSAETVKKAHLQHGHEGPGGTLAPGDVER